MQVKEITVKESWKSGKAMYLRTINDEVCGTMEESIWPQFKAGNYFKAWCDPPAEGKKSWRILKLWVPADDERPAEEVVQAIQENKTAEPQEIGLAHKLLNELYIAGAYDENDPDVKEMIVRHKMWLKKIILGR